MNPFTIVVADEATRAGGSAFDEAAHVAERIPLAGVHAVYLLRHTGSLAHLEDIAKSLRSDTSGRAASLGIHERLMGVHVRTGDPVDAVVSVARELSADLVVIGESERRLGSLLRRSMIDRMRLEIACPVVLARSCSGSAPEIEPACQACELSRVRSSGTLWWCEAHRRPRVHYRHRVLSSI
jgi:nucleotide-binding universal stress UspA family protein